MVNLLSHFLSFSIYIILILIKLTTSVSINEYWLYFECNIIFCCWAMFVYDLDCILGGHSFILHLGTIEYVSLTKDILPKALETMQKSFYLHENICVAFDVPNQPESFSEMDGLLHRAAVDGVSVVAIDKGTGEIAGAAFNKLEVRFQNYLNEKNTSFYF